MMTRFCGDETFSPRIFRVVYFKLIHKCCALNGLLGWHALCSLLVDGLKRRARKMRRGLTQRKQSQTGFLAGMAAGVGRRHCRCSAASNGQRVRRWILPAKSVKPAACLMFVPNDAGKRLPSAGFSGGERLHTGRQRRQKQSAIIDTMRQPGFPPCPDHR